MATLQEIHVTISKKGETKIDVIQGFEGTACLAATKDLEVAIGLPTAREPKPEMDKAPDILDSTRVGG